MKKIPFLLGFIALMLLHSCSILEPQKTTSTAIDQATQYPFSQNYSLRSFTQGSDSSVLKPEKKNIVKAVHDGDSYKLDSVWVRVLGMDSPEVISNHITANQAGGKEAGNFARELLKGKKVTPQYFGRDKFKRPLVKLLIDGKDIAEIMLENGHGWYLYSAKLTPEERDRYKQAVKRAKANKAGIWGAAEKPIPPSVFRAKNFRTSN
jgi:endonuclease YncB( thermonuclease family)